VFGPCGSRTTTFLLFKKCLKNCVSYLVPLQGLALNSLYPVVDCTDGDKIVSLDFLLGLDWYCDLWTLRI